MNGTLKTETNKKQNKTNPCPVLDRSLEVLEPSTDIFTAMTERSCWVSLQGLLASFFSGSQQMLFKKAACVKAQRKTRERHDSKGEVRKSASELTVQGTTDFSTSGR